MEMTEDGKIKFRSPAEAQGLVAELSYAVSHPEEEGLTEEQVTEAKNQLRQARNYLAECDE